MKLEKEFTYLCNTNNKCSLYIWELGISMTDRQTYRQTYITNTYYVLAQVLETKTCSNYRKLKIN